MAKKSDKDKFIVEYFSEAQPDVASELHYTSAYELLVATMLAAQCTDKRVNMVTPALFSAYPTVADLAKATEEEVLSYVKSVSYPNSKSRHLVQMAQMAVSDFGGKIPSTMEGLTKLPGVGRKTANVILAIVYDQPAMAVDTHVFRVSHRLGIVKDANTPFEVEKQLTKHFPAETIPIAHHWLILHGRYVCTARNPKCDKCGLCCVCDFFKKNPEQKQ